MSKEKKRLAKKIRKILKQKDVLVSHRFELIEYMRSFVRDSIENTDSSPSESVLTGDRYRDMNRKAAEFDAIAARMDGLGSFSGPMSTTSRVLLVMDVMRQLDPDGAAMRRYLDDGQAVSPTDRDAAQKCADLDEVVRVLGTPKAFNGLARPHEKVSLLKKLAMQLDPFGTATEGIVRGDPVPLTPLPTADAWFRVGDVPPPTGERLRVYLHDGDEEEHATAATDGDWMTSGDERIVQINPEDRWQPVTRPVDHDDQPQTA